MKHIGIIIESDQGKIKEINFGMITLARAENTDLAAIVLDADGADLKEDLEAYGITKIIDVCLADGQEKNPAVRAQAVIQAIKEYGLEVVFGLSTATGKDLLPRVAALMDAPLVMGAIHADLENNLVKTSQYSGKTIATIQLTGSLLVVGVRPNAVEPLKAEASAILLPLDATQISSRSLQVVKTSEARQGAAISLAEADVIISGGRGMKNKENFTLISQCAAPLKAAVGASRVAVDSGWVPYSMQVGQTGEKVSPRVYIACGISGSIQHFAGMKTSGMVIAVNTDETSAIVANCDYYAKADALEILPALIKVLENG